MRRKELLIIAVAVAVGAAVIFTAWQMKQAIPGNPADCNSSDTSTRIRGCTALIEASKQATYIRAGAYLRRGVGYRLEGKLDKAIADYSEAILLNPTLAEAYNNRGDAYDTDKQYDKAIIDASMALQINPNMAAAYDTRGNAKIHKGDKAGGEIDLAKARALGLK